MLNLFHDDLIPQYEQGKWSWNAANEKFVFTQIGKPRPPDYEVKAPKLKFGLQFKDSMGQIEEIIFRERFVRSSKSDDPDFIKLQDIKDVAFFTAPTEKISNMFIEFMHMETCDIFFNALIVYFEYFIKVVEFLLIRRDDLADEENSKIRNMDSIHTEKIIMDYLCQYRLLLAREYSKITIGIGDMHRFHHRANKMQISMTDKDRNFFEQFICFCTRIVWIAMHRRAYNVIDCEINRLFRSGHFNVAEKQLTNCAQFNVREQEVLYGPNDLRVNCRNQKSPLILEILHVNSKNVDILWIGEQKYRGTDPRLFQLELEYVTPASQLSFIDIQHGILGHPKVVYDTMLSLNWYAARQRQYSEDHDPYRLIRKPYLDIIRWLDYKKTYSRDRAIYKLDISGQYDFKMVAEQKRKWKNKTKIIEAARLELKTRKTRRQIMVEELNLSEEDDSES